MNIHIIAGARPNFMKIAPIIKQIKLQGEGKISFTLIHTGQHYDKNMSDSFFEELGIPHPDYNLSVGSGTHAKQTADIMIRYEDFLVKNKPNLCLVVGDVNSTLACSIAAKKLNIKVAHVEAGIRSGDRSMPEEINRLVTDAIADYFFTTSQLANQNLIQNGILQKQIYFVGNTMIDTLNENLIKLVEPKIWKDANLKEKKYFVLTLHRPSNVDDVNEFIELLNFISEEVENTQIIFPVHPRTKRIIDSSDVSLKGNLILVQPLSYLRFNFLVKNALGVITDSGGITEEATVLGVPCITLRENTERPETCTIGTNELVGRDFEKIKNALKLILSNQWKKGEIPELWDGHAAKRIVQVLKQLELN